VSEPRSGDDPVAALFEVPPDRFVAARDALARSLGEAGDKPGAAKVKALRKPSATVWTLNQLARRNPAELKALFEGGQAMRRAQAQAIGGQGADELRRATQATRKQIAALVRSAESIFAESGRKAGPAITRELYEALHAVAAADDITQETLRRGRLEVAPSSATGFGEVDTLPSSPARAADTAARSQKVSEKSPAAGERTHPRGVKSHDQTAGTRDEKARARDEKARAAEQRARVQAEARAAKAREAEAAAQRRAAEKRAATLRAKAIADERLATRARARADRLSAEATRARAEAIAAEHAAARSRTDADAAERLSRR
jgi:hypothetical protein